MLFKTEVRFPGRPQLLGIMLNIQYCFLKYNLQGLDFGINIENDRSESVPGKNSSEIVENVSDNSKPQSKGRKRKLCEDQPSSDNM